jgi:hypothetical protein
MMYWIPAIALLVHVLEEFPRFPAWASRHFGSTSRAWYVYTHVAIVTAFGVVSAQAQAVGPGTHWAVLALACQWVLATNALFHVATAVRFREYSPGIVTGMLVVLPSTAYLYSRAVSADLFTTAQVASAIALGTVLSAVAVASLWLPADFDWKLRRPLIRHRTPRAAPNEEL